jgi:hypothetical protein
MAGDVEAVGLSRCLYGLRERVSDILAHMFDKSITLIE